MKKRHLSKKSGMPPGSAVYTGTKTGETVINMLVFDDENFREYENISVDQAIELQGQLTTNWIIVKGFSQSGELQKLANHFEMHPLVFEDIFNVEHMPKIEDLDQSLFVTLKNLTWNEDEQFIESEQISLYLGANILISFEEKGNNVFSELIERLKTGKGKGRTRQEDYLCYLLIDHIVDNYYYLLDNTEEQIEDLEKLLIDNPSSELSHAFLRLKKNLVLLRKTVNPLREELRYLTHEESGVISEYTRQYLGDVNDHLSYLTQSIDSFRDMIASMMDLLMANNANRMNSIMKTLTLVSTIFIPMTLVSSIYGMNFDFMPELHWKYGYPVFLLGLSAMGLSMYLYMKKKNWF
ncbi:MAG TPA: magnesium/cobalt transporter CorA [Bacteroidales bacterium]|nr:magnesium/cobalt transporter CorA [Bacteroidales bacterium]